MQNNAIKFHHTDSDYSKMIRAYIDTVIIITVIIITVIITSKNYLLYFLPVFSFIYIIYLVMVMYIYVRYIYIYM